MKSSERLRLCAQRVEKEPGIVWNGLCQVVNNDKAMQYVGLFAKDLNEAYWFGCPRSQPSLEKKPDEVRILVLCFAADVAESKGD